MRYATMLAALAVLAPGTGKSTIEATLHNGAGAEVGKVTLHDDDKRIEIKVSVHGLPVGVHGMHLHAAGHCDGPDFQTAGGHLNPGGAMHHGHQNPQGPHLGDLGNLTVGADQKGEAHVTLSGAEPAKGLKSLLALGQDGLALVIHAAQDDEVTDPSGSSGARIACAVLR
jgi:Cu-Zn family superoxide dismutase